VCLLRVGWFALLLLACSQMVTLPRVALYHQVPSAAPAPSRIPYSEVGPSGPARYDLGSADMAF
jgi:hypothetical protein